MGVGARAGVEERIRTALVRGLAWTLHEANNETLWVRVRETANDLLLSHWRNGELAGGKAEEAFYVRCGPDTMTQQDLDNGRLILIVGIAPVAPAEFVVLRLEQTVGGQQRKRRLRRPAWKFDSAPEKPAGQG